MLISFGLEILTLLWGPAKDASVPHLVDEYQLASANSLSLVASYATFPIASIVFSLLAALAVWLGSFDALSALQVDQEALALLVDACTFLASAIIVFRLPIPHDREREPHERIDWTQTIRDIKEGLPFIAHQPRVRGVIVGLGVGLIGAGAMIPLGRRVREAGPRRRCRDLRRADDGTRHGRRDRRRRCCSSSRTGSSARPSSSSA